MESGQPWLCRKKSVYNARKSLEDLTNENQNFCPKIRPPTYNPSIYAHTLKNSRTSTSHSVLGMTTWKKLVLQRSIKKLGHLLLHLTRWAETNLLPYTPSGKLILCQSV